MVSADLHEGLDSTLLILKYRLSANEQRPAIQIVKDYGDLPSIDCFPGQLNQAFMNILANAIDIFDEAAELRGAESAAGNPPVITIETTRDAERNGIDVRIRDNGKGMSADVKSRIFDHLFTTKGVGKGTGLGLAIAKRIITDVHHGQITVDSDLGQGTTFHLSLPLQ